MIWDGAMLLVRLLLGHHLTGERKTNARWKTRGTELRDGYEHAGWWAHLPLRRRAGIRLVALVLLVANGYAIVTNFDQAVVTMRVEFWLAFALCVWWTIHRYRKFAHREGYVVPIGQVVADWLGYSRHVDPLDLVKVPLGHRTNPDKPVEISLPRHWHENPNRQKQLASHVASRAGIKTHDFEVIDGEGEAPRMLVRAQLVPPDEVLFSDEDVAALIRACHDDSVLYLGKGLHGVSVWIDWNLDSPHLALSFGSGAGKSTLVRSLAAQTVYKGGRAAIFDGGKDGESHQDWTRDEHLQLIPGVEFYPSIAEEHDALIAWEEERQRRAQAVLARTGEDFQRTLLVLEERNLTAPKLQAYWTSIREQGDPVKSPAVQAIANLVAAGRSVKMNCVAVAQRFDAASIGGGSVRASFQLRMLSRFDDQGRKMLIPEVNPKPRSSNHPGRSILVLSGELTELQALYMTADEAVALCFEGVEQTDSRITAPRPKAPGLAGGPRESLGQIPDLGLVQSAVEAPKRTLLTLNQAWQQGIVTGALEGVRTAAKRDGFPARRDEAPGGAYLYDAQELANWEAERQLRAATRVKVGA